MTTNRPTDRLEMTAAERKHGRKVGDMQILRFMATFADQHMGIPPTFKDIMKAVGIRSTAAVNYRLDRLVLRGWCYRLPGGLDKRRATTISKQGRAYLARLDKAARR